MPQTSFGDQQMENKKNMPATQQPVTQQQLLLAHHVHPNDQIYSHQHPQITTQITSPQPQLQPNGVMHQLLQSQYQSNMDARSPLLENRHDLYGTTHNHDYSRNYGANDNYNYIQSPQRSDLQPDANVNLDLLQNMPKGFNAEVYKDYLKRNPPKDANQIYQNHQPTYNRSNQSQYGSKPYLPYSSRITSQSNTDLLRQQYNQIQQMKLQQQMHFQNQAQMHQQQTFAERQMLLQQMHGIQPPPNLQNSLYSDGGSYRDLDRYASRNDFKDQLSSPDIQKEVDRFIKNNEYKEVEKQNRQYQESQYQTNQQLDYRDADRYRTKVDKDLSKSPEFSNRAQKNNVGVVSPMKSSESSSPSIKSPSSESRRSSSGHQALRSPVAQRIPSAPVTISGILHKQGSDGLKVWRKRWFVLSEYCLFYYKSQDEEKLLGSVLLPSYRVSACTTDDKVMRKFAFKLEHANMRTYVLAAQDQESMLKWVQSLTMAALMQSPSQNEQRQKPEWIPAKAENDDDVPGPTYANAPPKPRRSNEGYNSPSPEMYDPNYDLLKKPASHYSQGTSNTRYHEHTYQTSPNTDTVYTRHPQSPPQQQPYQPKRPYDTHNLSLPLTNTITDRLENTPSNPMYRTNPQSPYFDNRNRNSQQPPQKVQESNISQEQIYERRNTQLNPFLQDSPPEGMEMSPKENIVNRNNNINASQQDRTSLLNKQNINSNMEANYSTHAELNVRQPRTGAVNERLLIERRTPDAYGRSMAGQERSKVGDYEDVYASYDMENEYGRTYNKATSPPQNNVGNYNQVQSFSGPAILRRKKMQSSGIQPPVPRPHSADFLEYESRKELNKTLLSRNVCDVPRQPQRPKSSLDINSYYDPSSDRYYSEESYAQKMRQSVQYLQHDKIGPKNIQIPLAKYASGLAEKQLHSPYGHSANNNYELEFGSMRNNKDNMSYSSKYSEGDGISSNWTLKEKYLNNQREFVNRSASVMSDGSNVSAFVKDVRKFDPSTPESFMRSASARLPSSGVEREGDKKVQQREESMKRLLEWKQRMLQSPLTRKSTPATISLARSLNQSRQSVKSADHYKTKNFTNASYNSYSSDDEEQATGSDLQKSRAMQAGRSLKENLPSPIIAPIETPHELPPPIDNDKMVDPPEGNDDTQNTVEENIYENMDGLENSLQDDDISNDISKLNTTLTDCQKSESDDSEAESENQMEYTDDDLDEVLMNSDEEKEREQTNDKIKNAQNVNDSNTCSDVSVKPETPPMTAIENHYLPMSPRKISDIEPAHQIIIKNISVFDRTLSHGVEDNPYVEMTLGSEDDGLQNYEVVCVNNGKVEPVYMELGDASDHSDVAKTGDTASNFADTKEHTLKRVKGAAKDGKHQLDKKHISDCSDADDEASKDISLDIPFNRFSISDTFRPASYYLGSSRSVLDVNDSSDSEIISTIPVPNPSPPCDELSDLSKYVLEKLDKSSLSQDNSILKMLTNESQLMNTAKRKTTSLMIYGSKTSIHDTLSRGEKIRNSRASLGNTKMKASEPQLNLLTNSLLEQYNSSRSIETDSLISYNADRGSSRLSMESDISSKFEMAQSNPSSEVTSLNESDNAIELRHPSGYRDMEMMLKRRPLSDNSFFELGLPGTSTETTNIEVAPNVDLDRYLNNLNSNQLEQPVPDIQIISPSKCVSSNNSEGICKDNVLKAAHLQITSHVRCSSTPVAHTSKSACENGIPNIGGQYKSYFDQQSGYTGSQSSCSSVGIAKPPIAYYRKDCDQPDNSRVFNKNINNKDTLSDKILAFEREKLALLSGNETNVSSSTTGFHSRESSTEHSAPYYYSDLSSQEHINIIQSSHYLKNTNLHRKLNNQRRRGPLHKKNDISHIHNPIHNNNQFLSQSTFELAAAARSVSVEFLCAADKDPEIDMKNIYESTTVKQSKIPDSLMTTFGCKRNANHSYDETMFNNEKINCNVRRLSEPTTSTQGIKNSPHHKENPGANLLYRVNETAESNAYENLICHGDKLWDEDALWRDNLRRASHRHARSMDDLDAIPNESSTPGRSSVSVYGMNSLKCKKKNSSKKISRNVTYVNSDIQSQLLNRLDDCNSIDEEGKNIEKTGDNDVYVSLAENCDILQEQSDEGVYEQLAIEAVENNLVSETNTTNSTDVKTRRKFEIDREKLRQWDLMSSGLMKGGSGVLRGSGAGVCTGVGEALCSMDSGADSASNEASLSMPGGHLDSNTSNTANQQALSKKAFLGSNTSIGRGNRDVNIPVRAVSPRVRWVEEKPSNDNFGSQQFSASQQNIHNLSTPDDPRMIIRSPSRASQQPIKAVSPRVRRAMENDDLTGDTNQPGQNFNVSEVPTAGELLGRTHEELVLLLIQLRRRHAATLRAMDQCCAQINSIEESMASLKSIEREENIRRLEHLKMQLMELEHHYQKSKPLVQLVDNMVKLGSLYNRPGSTVERLERNQRLRQKVLAEHAIEQQRWLENAAAGKPLETEAARSRVAELWALEQELADEASLLQGMKTDKDAIESLLTGVRTKFGGMQIEGGVARGDQDLEAELARVHAMLALNSKKLEQTVADNARLERELIQLRRALHTQRQSPAPTHAPSAATALLEDEVTRVQQLVTALQRQRQELSRAVRHLTQQSRVLQITQHNSPGSKQKPNQSSWQETNLDTGHTTDHGQNDYDYEVTPPGHYDDQLNVPLYVDTRESGVADMSVMSPLTSEDMHSSAFGNLSNVEKQEIKTVRIVKRESERRQRDRERSLQPMSDWSNTSITNNLDQFLEEELVAPTSNRSTSLPRTDFSKFEEYYSRPIHDPNYPRPQDPEATNYGQTTNEISFPSKYPTYDSNLYADNSNLYARSNDKELRDYEQPRDANLYNGGHHTRSNEHRGYGNKNIDAYSMTSTKYDEVPQLQSGMETSSKFVSSPSLSNYDFSREISSLSSSYNKSYDKSGYDRTMSISTQYLNSPTDSSRTLTNDPLSKTSSIGSLTRSHAELSPIFKSEAAKQIITEMGGDAKNGSLHRRQVPKEKRRHYTAPHHLSAKTLNELPKEGYNQDKMGRSLDDADMERALRAPPDVVRSAIAPQRYAENTIDQLLAAPQKILIPERYIPEKPPELSPEEQQKRQEKVESIKKMLSGSSADPSKSPDGEDKRQREHLLQMNQILAKQVMEMSKIVAVKALEDLPEQNPNELDDHSPDVELPIYQQRDNFFS